MTLNPAFHRHTPTTILIGKMVISYGELEAAFANCLAAVLGDRDTGLRTLYRIPGESARVAVADSLMRRAYNEAGLEPQYADMIGAMRRCTKIRNQYAHCLWGDDPNAGLFFTELGQPARATDNLEYWWRHVDETLVTEQEEYFTYAEACMDYIEHEYRVRLKTLESHAFLMPTKRLQPNLHNPPDQHIPPWINEAQKQKHIERAQESK